MDRGNKDRYERKTLQSVPDGFTEIIATIQKGSEEYNNAKWKEPPHSWKQPAMERIVEYGIGNYGEYAAQ